MKWKQGQTWPEIANSYLHLGTYSHKIIVVFDGYSSSPKDHDHIRRTKNSCCDLKIRPNMIHLKTRVNFLENILNKSQLILLLSSTFRKYQIIVVQCDNDADTSIVREALAAATDEFVEVWAEDAHVLAMLVHHNSSTNFPVFLTTLKGFYDVRKIRDVLCERKIRYLLLSRLRWLRYRLVLQSSSTHTMNHVLLWMQIVTTCSRGKQRTR